ncbi:mitochondrial small ribosomal subunit Rsm22-domain-containing protein [Dichotomopilus funicola]|uniref:Mitochondrial small ribosomal subunit Rsm22-domain-containing protein n=1 Tax=Dichotomopilus funicola TaxID=1934379 RepID=A0AAN6V617_9PEZI|nr:mitochondrial small ribosomal subunit Rsm22-domain-containing protein [Dichotomopilus funicola]
MQNRCPGCRAQLLSFYDALLLPRGRPAGQQFMRARLHGPSKASPAAAAAASAAARPWHGSSARQFSTTVPVRQEPVTNSEPTRETTKPTPEEIETIVRQAKQTFGNSLPPDYLTPEEYKVYERLYGPPLHPTTPEDVGISLRPQGDEDQPVLLQETEYGTMEEVEYTFDQSTAILPEQLEGEVEGEIEETVLDLGEDGQVDVALDADYEAAGEFEPAADGQTEYLSVPANNQREYDVLIKLQRDFEVASQRALEEKALEEERIRQEEEAEEQRAIEKAENETAQEEFVEAEQEMDLELMEEEYAGTRVHEYTMLGQFKTTPRTLYLPKQNFVQPITELLGRTDPTHVAEAAERMLGGPMLPHGPGTPKLRTNYPQKGVAMEAGHHRMSQIEADTYLATVLPGLYATSTSILVEVRKRLGEGWIREMLARPDGAGPRVLDVGAGGAGLAAWEAVLQAEWDILRENGTVEGRKPPGKKTVVVGSENLRQRVSRFLDDTTFLPRLPDYLHSIEGGERKLDSGGGPAPRKVFDVIIASHQLMAIDKEWKRKDLLDNLWTMLNPQGGVLIVMEKGHPRGFEAVANVRDRVLDEFIIPPTPQEHKQDEQLQSEDERVREPGMIIAPCTNHGKCPMYLAPGLTPGRKDFCHFSQRFIRPPFLQKVLNATHHNHEDIDFSYVAVRRGARPDPTGFLQGKEAADKAFAGYEDNSSSLSPSSASASSSSLAPHPLSLPRAILPPLKRHGHITFDMCTPAGNIERWVVPKSFSKQAYHDARKSAWGDLWALGAKTRTTRAVRLGKAGVDTGDGGVRSRAAAAEAGGKSRGKNKERVIDIKVDPRYGMQGASERVKPGSRQAERRTKGGRRVKLDDIMKELGADKMEEEEDPEYRDFMRKKGGL